MMKTFTPTQLHQNPAKVFRAADKDGSVLIKHDRYPDVVFVISGRETSVIKLDRIPGALSIGCDIQVGDSDTMTVVGVDGANITVMEKER
jgi:hypothetical protein